MGQQNGNVACALAPRSRIICATRKIFFIERRLVRVARLLCCVHLEAAMHNRQSKTGAQIRFDFGIEQAQHPTDAIAASHWCNYRSITLVQLMSVRRRFEQHCSLKTK
jgi:hypothetical protein